MAIEKTYIFQAIDHDHTYGSKEIRVSDADDAEGARAIANVIAEELVDDDEIWEVHKVDLLELERVEVRATDG